MRARIMLDNPTRIEEVEAHEFRQPVTGELCMEVELEFGSGFMSKREFWQRCERADIADRAADSSTST
jgi:hypothetical protein